MLQDAKSGVERCGVRTAAQEILYITLLQRNFTSLLSSDGKNVLFNLNSKKCRFQHLMIHILNVFIHY